jgi:hypothetical protein
VKSLQAIHPSRRRNALIALLGAAVLAVAGLVGYLIWSSYHEEIRGAETTSRNYAAIIEARLDATLRRADAHLQELARELPSAALSKQAVPLYAHEIDAGLDLRLLNFPELAGLRIFDADGDMLYTTDSKSIPRVNIADRKFFGELRDDPRDRTVFSDVIIGRVTGRPSLYIARTFGDGAGAFRGVVNGVIDLEYLQELFRSLDIGEHGLVSIFRSDDFRLVTRWPQGRVKANTPLPPDSPARRIIAAGRKKATVEIPASTDGVARIFALHALNRYPFYVTVGLARRDVLAGWRVRSLAVGLSGLLLLLLLAGVSYRLWRAEALQGTGGR